MKKIMNTLSNRYLLALISFGLCVSYSVVCGNPYLSFAVIGIALFSAVLLFAYVEESGASKGEQEFIDNFSQFVNAL